MVNVFIEQVCQKNSDCNLQKEPSADKGHKHNEIATLAICLVLIKY